MAKTGKNKIYIKYDDNINLEDNHKNACRALREKLEWNYKFVSGVLNNDYVHVLTTPIMTLEAALETICIEFPENRALYKIAMIKQLRYYMEIGLGDAKKEVEKLITKMRWDDEEATISY